MAKTVLIADDSASVRLSVRLLLQGRHKELVVREAADGVDVIEKALQHGMLSQIDLPDSRHRNGLPRTHNPRPA